MGALAGELGECAADTEVAGVVGAATHVLHAGLDVMFRINQLAAGAPGLGTQQLLTGGLLRQKEDAGNRDSVTCKCNRDAQI